MPPLPRESLLATLFLPFVAQLGATAIAVRRRQRSWALCFLRPPCIKESHGKDGNRAGRWGTWGPTEVLDRNEGIHFSPEDGGPPGICGEHHHPET